MAQTGYTVEIPKNSELGRLAEVLGNPSTVLKVIGFRLQEWVNTSFKTAGRGQWQQLAASTVEARGGSGLPLRNTGQYQQSFVTTSDDKTYVQIGSDHPLAKFHEYGTGIHPPGGRGWYLILPKNAKTLAWGSGEKTVFAKQVRHPGVPARPVLPTKEQAEQIVVPSVIEALEKAVKGGDK